MNFKKIKKEEQRFLITKRELQSGKNERTSKPLTSRQKRKCYGVLHKWYGRIHTVHYGCMSGKFY